MKGTTQKRQSRKRTCWCGEVYFADREQIGGSVRCTRCGRVLTFPSANSNDEDARSGCVEAEYLEEPTDSGPFSSVVIPRHRRVQPWPPSVEYTPPVTPPAKQSIEWRKVFARIDWEEVYGVGYLISWVVLFIAAYIYCVLSYGFLLGLGLGWLPSAIFASVLAFLWPVLLLVGVAAVLLVIALLISPAG